MATNSNIQQIIQQIDDITFNINHQWPVEEMKEIRAQLKGLVSEVKIGQTREQLIETLSIRPSEAENLEDKKMIVDRYGSAAETIREHLL